MLKLFVVRTYYGIDAPFLKYKDEYLKFFTIFPFSFTASDTFEEDEIPLVKGVSMKYSLILHNVF